MPFYGRRLTPLRPLPLFVRSRMCNEFLCFSFFFLISEGRYKLTLALKHPQHKHNSWQTLQFQRRWKHTIFTDSFSSLTRKVVRQGLTKELKNKNTTDDSLSTNSHFFSRQVRKFASRITVMKYGTSDNIRNSKINNDVLAIFRSFWRSRPYA